MTKKKVIITNDNTESFTDSSCDNCDFCKKMHISVKEWDTFTPETNLQKNMINVIKKIEEREQKYTIK